MIERLETRDLPAQLIFTAQPADVSTGELLEVKVHSDCGADVPITVALSAQSTEGMPLLSGTVTKKTASDGTATFSDLVIYGGTGKNFTLIAAAGADTAISDPFLVKSGTNHLYVATQLPTTVAGDSLPNIVVQVLDVNGTLDTNDNQTQLQLYIDHNPGGGHFIDSNGVPITDPIKATAMAGVVTFTGVRLDKAGLGYTLGVQPLNNDLLPRATSNRFAVSAAQAAALAFQVQPTYTGTNDKINAYNTRTFGTWPGVVVEVVDRFGNQVTSNLPTGDVTIIAKKGTTTVPFTVPADATRPLDANTGVAVFAPNSGGVGGLLLSSFTAGTDYTLEATWTPSAGPALTAATSSQFGVGAPRGNNGLRFKAGSEPPTSFQVGATLPTIEVELLDSSNQVLVNNNTDRVSIMTGGILGALTVTVQNGVATFEDLVFAGVGGLDAGTVAPKIVVGYTDLPFGTFTPATGTTLLAGQAAGLAFVNPFVGTQPNPPSGPYQVTAATHIRDKDGNPLQVKVIDKDGNTLKTDSTTVVSLGVLRNEGRGPVFIGHGSDPTNGSYPSNPADPGLHSYASATVVNGVATFNNANDIYMHFVGNNYILSAGIDSFASTIAASSNPFNLVPGAVAKLKFINSPGQFSTAGVALNVAGPQAFPGQPGLAVAATDVVNNIVTSFVGPIKIDLVKINNAPGTLMGTSQVNAFQGVAIFDTLYVEQATGQHMYALTATDVNTPAINVTSDQFTVNPPFNLTFNNQQVNPKLKFLAQPSSMTSGVPFNFQLQVFADPAVPGLPANFFNNIAHVTLVLHDQAGNPLPTGPFLVGDPPTKQPGDNGLVSFSEAITVSTTTTFEMRALLDLFGQAIMSNQFQVTVAAETPPLPQSGTPDATTHIVQVGLGSYTEDFDDISAFPIYSVPAVGQRPYPPVDSFDPKTATTAPDMRQPNVAAGFNQVPQSSDWWSGLIFPRNRGGFGLPTDSQNNLIYPLLPGPLAARPNSNFTGSEHEYTSEFAGLGLGYLTNLFVTQNAEFTENPTTIPPGQPLSLHNPQYPGAHDFEYRYESTGDPRGYQDFSIGLAGIKADGKVLRYSDWTVTLEWDDKQGHKLEATLGEGLPYVFFTAPNASGQAIQLVTADPLKKKNMQGHVTIKALDASGNSIFSGTGPVLLEISYDVDDQENGQDVVKSVHNFYGLFLPSGVSWNLSGNTDGALTANLTSSKDYFSVAALPTPPASQTIQNVFQFYKDHAYVFVTGSTSSFSFNEGIDPVDHKAGKLTTTYALQSVVKEGTNTKPLQALFLHQALNLSADEKAVLNQLPQYKYVSPRGTMQIWQGPVFHTVLQHKGVLPEVPPMPATIGSGTGQQDAHPQAYLWHTYLLPLLQSVSAPTEIDGRLTLDQIFPNSNNYFEAQSMYGVIQLVPILLEIAQSGDTLLTDRDKELAGDLAQQVFNQVKDRMSAWLSAADDQALKLLYYQPEQLEEAKAPANAQGWQSLMSILSGFLSSESLNDHNLIGGYFIKTAALIAKYDSNWGDTARVVPDGMGKKTLLGKMGDVVNLIVQDISNYNRSSSAFPFLRNFDVYAGHSWVDGAANNTVGNNQESSSESLNYAAGLIQWGEVTGDRALRDLGIYLFNTELDAVETYYFNVKSTDAFPFEYTQFEGNTVRRLVTFLLGDGASYEGFIGKETTHVAGIQMLPFGGSSYYLGRDPNFVGQVFNLAIQGGFAQGDVPLTPPTYLSIMYPYQALTSPDSALSNYETNLRKINRINGGDLFDNHAFNIHWIEVLRAYGQVDATVTADTVSYAVFKKASTGVRTFVAYNPGATPRDVQFVDGSGNVLLTMKNVAPRTTQVSRADGNGNEVPVVHQTTADFSVQTPQQRFFFTTDGSGNPTLTHGKTGSGEKAVVIPPNSMASPVVFEITGLTGTLFGPTAQAFYALWADPQLQAVPPQIKAEIVYDRFGDGTDVTTHMYSGFAPAANTPGFAQFLSTHGSGLFSGSRTGASLDPRFNPYGYPPDLKNGKVTVKIWDTNGSGLGTRLRTDAAAEQGRVSFLELPYHFTQVNGQPVSQIDLGGQAFGDLPPEQDPPPGLALSAAPGGASPGYTASLIYSDQPNNIGTATFTAATLLNQTLQITLDKSSGLLKHNRASAGDPGFASDFDFDSFQPGEQHLAANLQSAINVNNGNGDSVVLGSSKVPVTTLLAQFAVSNSGSSGQLIIDDGARNAPTSYLATQGAITAPNLNVQLQDDIFNGGILLVTSASSDLVSVLGTRLSESLTVDTRAGADHVVIGTGTVTNILGPVTVKNSSPGSFSDLVVDNLTGVDFAPDVTISSTMITGLAPAGIFFSNDSLDDVAIHGGTNAVTYHITGSLGSSKLELNTGGGADTVIISNAGVIGGTFQGRIKLDGGIDPDQLVADNHLGAAKTVLVTDQAVGGLTRYPIQYLGFTQMELNLGDQVDQVTLNTTVAGPLFLVKSGGGADVVHGSVNADIIIGGPDNDQLFGEGDDDLFIWNNGDGSDFIEGGPGTNTLQVLGAPLASDLFTIAPNGNRIFVSRTNAPTALLNIGTTQIIDLFTDGGNDAITVTPLAGTTVNIDGGVPTVFPGDKLFVKSNGTDNPQLVLGGPRDGQWTFANAQPINFNDIERFNRVGLIAAGPGGGQQRVVRVFRADRTFRFQITAYGANFRSGIRVAVGDVNRDGTLDILTAPGPRAAGVVKVFSGVNGQALYPALRPFGTSYSGGIFVAAGDVNGDGYADIIVGREQGPPRVKVFSGLNLSVLASFRAFAGASPGGVRVAAGDVNFDGKAEIIVSSGPGAAPLVRIFSGTGQFRRQFQPFVANQTGGVFVTAGDVNGDGRADIVVGLVGAQPLVRVFTSSAATPFNFTLRKQFRATPAATSAGVRVGLVDYNDDGRLDVLAALGATQPPRVRIFNALTAKQLDAFFAFEASLQQGVFVAGGG